MITNVQARAILTSLGWPATVPLAHAIRGFQAGTAFVNLTPSGTLDNATSGALQAAATRHAAGAGTASQHFSFSEFACGCRGRYGCDVIWVTRDLVAKLEIFRALAYPGGLEVVSGCRCPKHNAEVGGADSSQHLTGRAADVPPVADKAVAERVGFHGIGFSPKAHPGLVVHVDVRPTLVAPFPDGP